MIYKTILASLTTVVIAAASSFAQDSHKSGPFQGAKANTGYVAHTTENGNSVLTLSDDFKAPDTPDPHWQVVDSTGNTSRRSRLRAPGQITSNAVWPRLTNGRHDGKNLTDKKFL